MARSVFENSESHLRVPYVHGFFWRASGFEYPLQRSMSHLNWDPLGLLMCRLRELGWEVSSATIPKVRIGKGCGVSADFRGCR